MIIEYSADIQNSERSCSSDNYCYSGNSYFVRIKEAEDVGRFGYAQPKLIIGVSDNRENSIRSAIYQLELLTEQLKADLAKAY